jgi:hypothetical protein
VLFSLLSAGAVAGQSAQAETWKNTGLSLPSKLAYEFSYCVDGSQLNILLVANRNPNFADGVGTYAYYLANGTMPKFSNFTFQRCIQTSGLLISDDNLNTIYSLSDPQGFRSDHHPDYFAQDGTRQIYSLTPDEIYYSADNGHNWEKRPQPQFNHTLYELAVSPADARVIYAMTRQATPTGNNYQIYFSADAGQSWEKRFEKNEPGNALSYAASYSLGTFSAQTAPANLVTLEIGRGAGSTGSTEQLVSNDGGRTFISAGSEALNEHVQLYYTPDGVVRLKNSSSKYELSKLENDGNWHALNLPFQPVPFDINYGPLTLHLYQYSNAPNNLFLSYNGGPAGLWTSTDSGQTWHQIASDIGRLSFSSYAPLTIIAFDKDNHISTLNLTLSATPAAKPAQPSQLPGSDYYELTKHNLWGVFKQYWHSYGGLAQFGYPRSEPFREYNPSDGKVYTVQYFERNRFEYHPEYKGTQYEVLLGLLGNQQTQERRDNHEGAFNRFDDLHYPGGIYFSQTGHNLRNSFKAYWEAQGGLAIYGYPISEEFQEVNPDDGKTYVVQYFERNRFEYHPEYKGTRYEVLLGLLGNTLLRQRSWL